MLDYLDGIFLRGRDRTAVSVGEALDQFRRWTQALTPAVDPLRATSAHLDAYQDWLVTAYRTPGGEPLARRTAAQRIGSLKTWYAWLVERGHLIVNPARHLGIRVPVSRVVLTEHLTLQEATALVQAQAARVAARRVGNPGRANELRNLAAICLGLATGRRISGICALTVAQVDCDRREVCVDHEKGSTGRVLPVAGWAVDVVRWYLAEARPGLTRGHAVPWLFVDLAGTGPIQADHLRRVLRRLLAATIRDNPDLTDLPGKRISWHSLRVSFATLLFQNGCDIRSVNELLLHRRLTTTAAYTPVPVEDLRQVFRTAHPRA